MGLRGAAAGAIYEMRAANGLRELAAALGSRPQVSPQALSVVQLRAVFDALDAKGDGALTLDDLNAGLEMLGIVIDPAKALRDMSRRPHPGEPSVNFDEF